MFDYFIKYQNHNSYDSDNESNLKTSSVSCNVPDDRLTIEFSYPVKINGYPSLSWRKHMLK